MRLFCARALTFLVFACSVASGQVPANWDRLLEAGIVADDESKYGEAAQLLRQACDLSLAAELGSERLTRACLLLTRVYQIDGKRSDAVESADRLAEVLDQLPAARPADRVGAWISVADVYSTTGDFEGTMAALKRATDLTQRLGVTDGVLALAEIATFYLPMRGREFGEKLVTAAVKRLNIHTTKSGVGYVHAAQKVSRLLNSLGRRQEVIDLLVPVFQQAEKYSESSRNYDDLWREYESAATVLGAVYRATENGAELDRLTKIRERWPQLSNSDQVGHGRMTKRKSPVYPPGAKLFKVQGTVQLSIQVGVDGRVHDVRVETPVPYGLTWAAVRAVRLWVYEPSMLGDKPIPIRTDVNVVFQLGR